MSKDKKVYVLTGKNHVLHNDADNSVINVKTGEQVELTDAQFQSFKDKFTPAEVHSANVAHDARIKAAIRAEEAKIAEEDREAQEALTAKAIAGKEPEVKVPAVVNKPAASQAPNKTPGNAPQASKAPVANKPATA
jgi:hypothetical protein